MKEYRGKSDKSPDGTGKKYTFILPTERIKKVKHSAVEQDKTNSRWLTEAITKHLKS